MRIEARSYSIQTALTQTTMGLSRDDYTKFSKEYENLKIFKADPFAAIDQEGVGQLIETAIRLGRKTRPDLEIGICGEHRGEPALPRAHRAAGSGAGSDLRQRQIGKYADRVAAITSIGLKGTAAKCRLSPF